MAMAFAFRSGFRHDRAGFSVFVRPGLSGVIRYRCDTLAAKAPGEEIKTQEKAGAMFKTFDL